MECSNYVGSMIASDARCTRDTISRITMANAAFNRIHFDSKLDFNTRKILLKVLYLSIASFAESWTLCKVDQKYLECFEMRR